MACIKWLIINVVLATSVYAFDNGRPRFHQFTVPLPPIPGFVQIPFPNIRVPVPVIPTLTQIKNTIPGPGQLYNGVFVKSTSGLTRDKDGKLVKTGGNYALINNNGKVDEYQRKF